MELTFYTHYSSGQWEEEEVEVKNGGTGCKHCINIQHALEHPAVMMPLPVDVTKSAPILMMAMTAAPRPLKRHSDSSSS